MKSSHFMAVLLIVVVLPSVAVLWYLGAVGLLFAVPWILLFLVLTNLDKVLSFAASFFEFGSGVSFWFERNAVEKRLESTIRLTSKKVNEEVSELLPHGIDIKWVKPIDRDAFLKEGKVVVCLESSQNQDRNLARATMLFVDEDLIRESQRFVDSAVMRSASYAIVKKMLMVDKRFAALKCLNDEFIVPAADKTPIIREYVPAMESMDAEGVLTRVLLREFSHLHPKLSPRTSYPQAIKETKDFADLLRVFIEKEPEEDVPLLHLSEVMKVGLVPIARHVRQFSVSFYLDRTFKSYKKGVETLYVMARGQNIKLAKRVIEGMERAGIYSKREESEFRFFRGKGEGNRYVAILIKSSKPPDPRSLAFQELRDITKTLHEGGKRTGMEVVVHKIRDAGINYTQLGYKKFGDFVRDAEAKNYVAIVNHADQTPTIEPT